RLAVYREQINVWGGGVGHGLGPYRTSRTTEGDGGLSAALTPRAVRGASPAHDAAPQLGSASAARLPGAAIALEVMLVLAGFSRRCAVVPQRGASVTDPGSQHLRDRVPQDLGASSADPTAGGMDPRRPEGFV